MTTNPTISLDHDWMCFYGYPEELHMEDAWTPGLSQVDSLSDWVSVSDLTIMSAYIFRWVDLEPTDFCVQYRLHVESAPGTVRLEINQQEISRFDGSQPFTLDVTDYLTLERCAIALIVGCTAEGKFGAVYLEQIPCE